MPTIQQRPTLRPPPLPVEPAAGQPPPRRVTLRTGDGVRLEGSWHAGHQAQAVAVVVHGFAASRDDPGVADLARRLRGTGLDVLAYDARGHGRSGGECAVGSREHLDVAAVAGLAAAAGRPVVLVGVSMGAVAVVRYLASSPPAPATPATPATPAAPAAPGAPAGVAGAVLVSGPARWRMRPGPVGLLTVALTRTGVGRRAAARWLRVRVAAGWRAGEAPESMLARVPVPVAVVHGAGDRLLGRSHGVRLQRAAPGPARLDLVDGMGHGLDGAGIAAAVDAVGWILEPSRRAAVPATGA